MYYWRIYNFVTEMRFAVRKSTAFVKNKKRKHCKINVSASYMRAADGNRTRDLRTTNATLYRLSHSSFLFSVRSREPRIYYHAFSVLSTIF